jgi:hypothetical protein
VAVAEGDGEAIVFKCDWPGHEVSMLAITQEYLGAGSNPARNIKFRVDKNTAFSETWIHDKSSAHQFDFSKTMNS